VLKDFFISLYNNTSITRRATSSFVLGDLILSITTIKAKAKHAKEPLLEDSSLI